MRWITSSLCVLVTATFVTAGASAFDRKPMTIGGLTADGWGQSTTGAQRLLKGRYPGISLVYCEGIKLAGSSGSSWVHGSTRYWDKLICGGYTVTTGETPFDLIFDGKRRRRLDHLPPQRRNHRCVSSKTAARRRTSAGSASVVHAVTFAPHLAPAADFTGGSIRDTRLSAAAYTLSKLIGQPKTVDVACWDSADWAGIAGDTDSVYSTVGFWAPSMPHWVNLSPGICGAMERLLTKRPLYPNVYTAAAVETLTHELMHAIGIKDEAQAECYGMQLSAYMAEELRVPAGYAMSLARLNLDNYKLRPPNYIDLSRCRENGAWDLSPGKNSPPWNT